MPGRWLRQAGETIELEVIFPTSDCALFLIFSYTIPLPLKQKAPTLRSRTS
jgi:hypothetical protein